ncbi:Hypothetical predicted protein [Pelobates cultripes]|uniref:Uncharacterized protein n=1 Tax=Pelobates cultripes TaxID=61616 RepID=A0AAD1WTA4_PELCU|nr:Hypothetical predicted protein [Pelobates cultripes]
MAAGSDTRTKRLTPSEWAIAFQASFEAICRRFWASMEARHQPQKPPTGSTTANTPTARQPDGASHPKRQQTRAQLKVPQPSKVHNKPLQHQMTSPPGTRATRGATPTRHPGRRKKTKHRLKHRSETLCSHTPNHKPQPHKRKATGDKCRTRLSTNGAHRVNPSWKTTRPQAHSQGAAAPQQPQGGRSTSPPQRYAAPKNGLCPRAYSDHRRGIG